MTEGYWCWRGGQPALLLKRGDSLPIPGMSDKAIVVQTLGLNDDGTMSLNLSVGPTRYANGEYLVRAAAGGGAPGTDGLSYVSVGTRMAFSPSGGMVWLGSLEGPGVTVNNDTALWHDDGTAIRLVAREGYVVPGDGGVLYSFLQPTLFGSTVVFRGGYREATTQLQREAIWRHRDGTLSLVAKEFGFDTFANVGQPQADDAGFVYYVQPQQRTISRGAGGTPEVLIPLNAPLATSEGSVQFTGITIFSVNGRGDICFVGAYRDPAGAARAGVWTRTADGRLRLIANNTMRAPGTSANFFLFPEVGISPGGRVIFRGQLPRAGGINPEGIWVQGPEGELHLLAITGSEFKAGHATFTPATRVALGYVTSGLNGLVPNAGRYGDNQWLFTVAGRVNQNGTLTTIEGRYTATFEDVPKPKEDFGDAPATQADIPAGALIQVPSGYPTTGLGAASHQIVDGYLLGHLIDPETDGQPKFLADGDDGDAAGSDEDGIHFVGPSGSVQVLDGIERAVPVLYSGYTNFVQVDAIVSAPIEKATLNAWIDFNGDGDWNDAGEHVVVDSPVTRRNRETAMPQIGIFVPPEAASIYTFARFRLNAGGGIGPAGAAGEGEVEDYLVAIWKSPPAPWIPGGGEGMPAGGGSGSLGVSDFGGYVRDFGDAPVGVAPPPGLPPVPTGYPVAGHVVLPGLSLGLQTDGEPATPAGFTASGDDAIGAVDDEDGVVFPGPTSIEPGIPNPVPLVAAGADLTMQVTVNTRRGVNGWLHAWFDWNRDGDWDDPGEHSLRGVLFAPGAIVTRDFRVAVPALTDLNLGLTVARFRVSTFADLPPGLIAPDGEVEDYLIRLVGMDFGDAPDDPVRHYRTTLDQDGARHLLGNTLVALGRRVDPDHGEQQDGGARADDEEGIDDEDGVEFETPLVAGQLARVRVFASSAAKLDAWIDWNRNGDWKDLGERILDAEPLKTGTNVITFVVSPDLVPGPSFARFRLSSRGGLESWGLAADGEVEDYSVELGDRPGTIQSVAVDAAAGELTLVWVFAGQLESASSPDGPWTVVPEAESPYRTSATGSARFFRVLPR